MSARAAARGRAWWLAAAAAAAAGCAGTEVPAPTAAGEPWVPPLAPVPVAAVTLEPVRLPAVAADDYGPAVLRPDPAAVDGVIARVGGLEVHKRHVYDRLLETNPQQARDLVDNVVLDCLVADLAERYGIRVEATTVAQRLDEEEKQLRDRLASEWRGQVGYEQYLLQEFGMDAAEHQRWRRLTLVRTLYRQYVIRYQALRTERVQVRYMVSSDRAQLEAVRAQVVEGASFSRLALRHSEDESRKDGGLLPPFGPGMRHPVAEIAFRLDPGELSAVEEQDVGGQKRFYLVSCVRRIPARDAPFAAVRDEIDEDIKLRPLTRFDFLAFYFQTRGEAESQGR